MAETTKKRNKWALLIGVNKYQKLPTEKQLNGCVNDVELMADTLQRTFGVPTSNITLLRDEDATRDGILKAFDTLADRVGQDDIVVIHYSGHGSKVLDREGDEPDCWDETIVPHDAGRSPEPFREITDDEIYLWLLRLTERTLYVTLIFDCCHSGSITRDLFGDASRWLEPDERPLEELPPSPIASEFVKNVVEARRDVGTSGWLPLGKRYVLLAGCRDEESSYEHQVGSTKYGALTHFLNQELIKAEPGATYRDVFERASTNVTAVKMYQHPQMEGARDRELFGVRDIEPMRFVPVRQRMGDVVNLGAGAAHGMTVGSEWAIYPQAIKHVTETTPKLGQVKITAVYAVTSDAQILQEEQVGAIAQNARSVEVAHFYGDMRLKVNVQAPAGYEQSVSALTGLIKGSQLLSLVETSEDTDVRAYLVAPRTQANQGDPVPQLGAVSEATWAFVERTGLLVMPTHGAGENSVDATLCENLEKMAQYRNALELRNADVNSVLKDKVEFVLLQQTSDSSWAEAKPDDASGQIIYRDHDRIAARIVNRHNSPIYISILDFGLTGAIALLHPVTGASEQLAPGRSIQIGVRQGDEIELYTPDNYPYISDPNAKLPPGGTETFKLLATTHEADFSPLIQSGFRGGIDRSLAKGISSPLGQLLDMALTGHGMREARHNSVAANEEWTTVRCSFFLGRREV